MNEMQGLDSAKGDSRVYWQKSATGMRTHIEAIGESILRSNAGWGLGKSPSRSAWPSAASTVSPPIFETLVFLGKERSLRRIDRCLSAVI